MALTDQQIVEAVSAALDTSVELANSTDGWKQEKEKDGAVIKSKKNAEGRKVWLCEAAVAVPAATLWAKLQDTGSLTSWNSTLTESRVIKTVEDVKISYQVTTEGGAGVVSARDFVYGSKCVVKPGGVHIMGGRSVDLAEEPEVSGKVRAIHGPGCQIVKEEGDGCRFTWLMDCDYRGMIPSSVVELAMPTAQLQMIECIRALA